MMKHWIRLLLLPLALLLLSAPSGCMPELDPGTDNKDTGGGEDKDIPGDHPTILDGVAKACEGSAFPECKTTGVCSEISPLTGVSVVYDCDQDSGEWKCKYKDIEGYQAKETLCDGLDNDCDGDKDEADEVAFEDACPDMDHGVCSLSPGAVQITCMEVGNPPVYSFQCDATNVPDYVGQELFDPQAEDPGVFCDNLDNDCDGDTDEDHEHFDALTPTDVAALTFSLCQGFGGICHAAVANEDPYQANSDVIFRCNKGGMECNYDFVEHFDAPESLCDGLDNDCDGDTDEVTDITESDCPYHGVCDGKVGAVCLGGEWICDMTQVLASPEYQIKETLCDGLDNDCDGDTDEGLDWESIVEARCGTDCESPFCATWNSVCVGALSPTFKASDQCPLVHRAEELDGDPWVPDLDPFGRPLLPGVCGYDPITSNTDVLLHCIPHDSNNDGTPEGAYFTCRYDAMEVEGNFVHTNNESLFHSNGHWCDNQDNDCDGVVDGHRVTQSVIHEIAVTETNPEDLPWTTCKILGECGLGTTATCQAGTWNCTYGAGPVEVGTGSNCANPDDPACQWTESLCDGKDNDCDGEVDEGISSAEGDALVAAGCNQSGVCAGAIQAVCNDGGQTPGVWSCDYSDAYGLGYAPLEDGDPTLCDGLDNDCDGEIDEEISAGPLDSNYLAVIDAAGCLSLGICDDAVTANCNSNAQTEDERWSCEYPVEFYSNTVLVQGIHHENMCDGLDNDCDGAIDENLDLDFGGPDSPKYKSQCSLTGICSGTMQWGCSLGSWTCQGDPSVGWEAIEASCDNVDNDCDGEVDEGLTEIGPSGANCEGFQNGVCQVGLAASCNSGDWTCFYDGVQNYEANEVSCDGLDNDCDGDTDESLNWTSSPGLNACKSLGVCDPTEVIAVCTGTPSGWLCNYDGIPTYVPKEELGHCDGRDNDCDGEIDEQACGPCSPCLVDSHCYNNLCRSDPFDGETYCATGATTCVMEDLGTQECMSVAYGQTACVSRTTRAICGAEGTWNVEGVSDCTGNTPICHGGLCKLCVPLALSCQGATVLQCDDGGNNLYQIDDCAPGQICIGAGDCYSNTEFQVDILTAHGQNMDPKPRVVGLKGGGFVVVWASAHTTADGSGTAVMGRIFDNELSPAGDSFVINETLENDQAGAAVDASVVGQGRFVAAWTTTDTGGDEGQGIMARVFEADGTPVTGEIHVNQITEQDQSNPAVTMYTNGRFLVSWDHEVGADNYDIKARYFDAGGVPEGDEFTLNTFLATSQRIPDVDFLSDGGIAAAWGSLGVDGSGFAVIALTLDEMGAVALDEMTMNEYVFNSQKNPVVVAFEEGEMAGWFAVIWESSKQASGDSSGIFMDLVNPAGVQVGQGADIPVHQNDTGAQSVPRAARLAGDDLVIVWESDDADAFGVGIARRIFNSSGQPESSEGLVNQSITGDQLDPDVAAIDPTTFVVVWTNSYTGHVMGRILND